MPCNGVAVMTAETAVDLEEYMSHEANREAFRQWLLKQNVPAKGWWPAANNRWAIGIGSDWTGLKFVGATIEVSDEGQYNRFKDKVDQAAALATVFAGQLAQSQVLDGLVALGFTLKELAQDGSGGVSCVIDAGIKTKVKISRSGGIELITQEGDFATGKTTLEALLTALQAQGVSATQSGQVETHRHDLQITHLHDHQANISIGQDIHEGGAPHTH